MYHLGPLGIVALLFSSPLFMDLHSSFWGALTWLRTLVTNLYFWGGFVILLGIGFGSYLIVDAMIMPSYTRHNVSTRVPNVENRPFEEADSLLQQLDLQVERQVGRYNPNVEQGLVVDQTPLPNSDVKPGRRVYLTVNAGEVPTVQVPDLTGMSVREAKNRITSAGFVVDTVREDPIPSPYPNTITKQTPTPGDSLKKGKAVELWYSTGKGEEEVGVPLVVGYTVDVARDALLRQNLRAVVVDASPTTSTQGAGGEDESAPDSDLYVRRQGNSPGSKVRAGSKIRLFTTQDQSTALERREALEDTTGSSN